MAEQSPPTTELRKAILLHQQGELTEAEAAYRRVLEAEPDQPDAWHLLGVLAHQRGDSEAAIERIRRSLAIDPRQPLAQNNLGNVLFACGRVDEALASYDAALAIRPNYPEAHHNRANVLARLQRTNEALAGYERAVALQPDYAAARRALATMYEDENCLPQALEHCRWLVGHAPPARHQALQLGRVLRKLNRLDEACEVYRQWLSVEPDDALAGHFLAACGGLPVPARAADECVQATFDNFADEFDDCLAKLAYRVPALVDQLVQEAWDAAGKPAWDVADLGCGTGLCGPGLRVVARRSAGVDLSAPMLAKARERGTYDELAEQDLVAFLRQRPGAFDLLVSGDTLVYFGDLEPVFAAAAQALRPAGMLVFSVERQVSDPAEGRFQFQLNRFGRYVHRPTYVRETLAAAGFELLVDREEVLRCEAGEPVPGLLVAARKS